MICVSFVFLNSYLVMVPDAIQHEEYNLYYTHTNVVYVSYLN